jgi:tRNA(His) 5'-end guanylyltransferase
MNNKDSLGDRMKIYENVTRSYLTRRVPVIIRLDGKAFHSFTRGLKKPFDDVLVKSMQDTMKHLCENIQGCVLGYTQSDEITLVLIDYRDRNTSAWFDNNVQKMVSVSASIATMAFNNNFMRNWEEENRWAYRPNGTQEERDYANTLYKKLGKAMFDSRVFTLPKEEVVNCLIWRQQDATRNSIQSVGQANFSQKQLHGKSCNDIQDMLMLEKGINWNDCPTHLKRGSCCIKVPQVVQATPESEPVVRFKWIVDNEIPIFTQDKEYVNKLVFI